MNQLRVVKKLIIVKNVTYVFVLNVKNIVAIVAQYTMTK
jgi:hypothetical protein